VGGAESQYLYDRRHSATSALLSLRSAAQGLTALASAGVDFVSRQVAAVRRVLTDPIQRYLLAYEVGLGKTIEAGLIIRQHLIDNPDTEVLIVTPRHLCEQWRAELGGKLRLDQFGDVFECISHAELAQVMRSPDILIIDEAHHIVGIGTGPLAASAARLHELAAQVPVLLLLSATPALGDEARFLALLNLLDPLTHPLDDIDAFRAKLEQRREFGRILLSLNPESPGLVLRQRSAELQRLFPDDPLVSELAPRLATATRDSPEDVASVCAALKEHIADSYRIHQRLIRLRRADGEGWEFMPRGPKVNDEPGLSLVKIESDPNQLVRTIAALED
jgi:ATP-dependent helicase HepA